MAEAAPERLGKYQVTDLLGQGAMGVVYRALDPLLNRYVAVKVMSPGIAADQELRDRFLREARAAGSLQHPNIITIYDFGDADGSLYIAMEYVEGSDLSEIIARQDRLPLVGKIDIIIDVLQGLDYAHSRGLVHRDVKPANIRVSVDGHAKLMDFGIARLEKSNMTRTGMVLGTPDYMAPEQVTGGTLSAATDVFAIGVVLYEFLTNRRTFDGETLHAVLYQVVSEQPPPLREAVAALPPSLQPILDKALAKDPAQRYQSAGAMVRDLTRVRTSLSDGATVAVAARATPLHTARMTRPPSSPGTRRARLAWIGAGAGVVALGVGAVLFFGTRHPRVEPAAAREEPAAAREVPAAPAAPAPQAAAQNLPQAAGPSPAAGPPPAARVEPSGAGVPPAGSWTQARRRLMTRAQPEGGEAAPAVATPAGGAVAAGQPRADSAAPAAQPAPAAPHPSQPPAVAQERAPSPPAAEAAADARPQLEALVAAYATAIESRSVPEIQRLYPGMTGPQQQAWEQFFSTVRTVRVQLAIARLDVSGAAADVTVAGSMAYEAGGRSQRQPLRFQSTAAQMDGGWHFRTIR